MPSHAGPAGRSVRRFFLNRASSWPGEWRIHRVKPFPVSGDPATTLRRLRNAVAAMPRTRIETATESHLHAVCRTRFLRFRDDLEFRYSAGEHVVHVQSASRWGHLRLRREPAAGRTGAKGASRLIRLSELPTARLRQGGAGSPHLSPSRWLPFRVPPCSRVPRRAARVQASQAPGPDPRTHDRGFGPPGWRAAQAAASVSRRAAGSRGGHSGVSRCPVSGPGDLPDNR